jgi:hypothetical protein
MGLIVTINVSRPRQRNTHHTDLISQSPQRFDTVLHGNKLAQKPEISIVACCFDSQMIGAKLQKMINLVQERWVRLSPAWSQSTIIKRQRLCQVEEAYWEELLLPHCHKTPSNQKMEGSPVNVRVCWVKDES